MAALSSLPVLKSKKQVYGRLKGRSNWDANGFFDDDELATSEPVDRRQTNVKSSYAVKKPETKAHGLKPIRPRAKRQDTFDVPSSDDEVTSPVKKVSPPQVRNTLVDDTDSSVAPLAPWEKRRAQSDRDVPAKMGRNAPASPEAQLRDELARATTIAGKVRSLTPSPKGKSSDPRSALSPGSQSVNTGLGSTSALARLAARRGEASRPIQKRCAVVTEDVESTPRKRARTSTGSREGGEDVLMIDAPQSLDCEMAPMESKETDSINDVHDIPGSSEDEVKSSKPRIQISRPARTTRRGKLTTYTSKSKTLKGVSAPARLTEMLDADTDTTEAPTRSPSSASRRSTPQQQPSTPPSGKTASPETAIKASGTMTPKQARLWNQLLPNEPVAPSPSTLPIEDLSISGKRRIAHPPLNRRLTKSQSDVPRRRTRLVDRLKASATSSDDEFSGTDEEESEIIEDSHPERKSILQERPAPLRRMSSQQQSQSQTTAKAASGPKITYAHVRSFLPEDSLEDDLMAGMSTETPEHVSQAGRHTKNAPASQKSMFDLDDSDNEEAGSGKIRTIHELRASGRNVSGMYDIEELLGEIQNHSVSQRSRRRSALMELATKLADKSFTTRFVGQSLEMQLAAECGSASDEIADFVLAAAVSLILAAEPPEHAVRSLHDQGIVAWFTQLLNRDTEITQMAKDRRNNMSKSAQESLIQFTEMVGSSSLWGEERPSTITLRLMALKALDQLISRLRRLGDRTDLLNTSQLVCVRPTAHVPFGEVGEADLMDLMVSISVLESLSTTTVSLSWPSTTIKSIAEIIPRLNTTLPTLRHSLFLILRLSLNLTNDNSRNCDLLVDGSAVLKYLMDTVKQGFDNLDAELEDEKRALALDLLVLAMGIMINLAENCDKAREQALEDQDTLSGLIDIFQNGQKRMLDAESVEESISNVAFGYLAVMLSNHCQHHEVKEFIASKLPGKNLSMLVEAVEEFVRHHQKVDMMNFEGEEGTAVWGAFTEKLKVVLARLKEAERGI